MPSLEQIYRAIGHSPELCALFTVQRFRSELPSDALKWFQELEKYLLDEIVRVEDDEKLHAIDIRLNDLGEAARQLATRLYENKPPAANKDEQRRAYATHFLVMSLRSLASAAWKATLALRDPRKADGIQMPAASTAEACMNYLFFLEMPDEAKGRQRADAFFESWLAAVPRIPPRPEKRKGLQKLRARATTEKALEEVLDVLLGADARRPPRPRPVGAPRSHRPGRAKVSRRR